MLYGWASSFLPLIETDKEILSAFIKFPICFLPWFIYFNVTMHATFQSFPVQTNYCFPTRARIWLLDMILNSLFSPAACSKYSMQSLSSCVQQHKCLLLMKRPSIQRKLIFMVSILANCKIMHKKHLKMYYTRTSKINEHELGI